MTYPTLEEVEVATPRQLGIWLRFLPSPGVDNYDKMDDESDVLNAIADKFTEQGGWNSALSKLIGWG